LLITLSYIILAVITVQTIALPSWEIPLIDVANVFVVGGGMAGIMAALGAAKTGIRVALVERYDFLGGMATNAMVGPFAGVRHRYGCGRIIGGIPRESLPDFVSSIR
jgi:NADPH-dependent 2,4-dienoyl-CoA reductase/sulfur reductase-like enzyme